MIDENPGFFRRISMKWHILKLEATLRVMEKEHNKCRKEDCRRGCHKIISQTVSWKKGKERTVTIRYIKCIHCNYLFFAKKSDKDKFMKYQGKDKESFSAFLKAISSLKTKHCNKVGVAKGEDVSSRCPNISFQTYAEFNYLFKGWNDVSELNYWARKIKFQGLNRNYRLVEI